MQIDSKKGIWSWALYDWANSAFATTVMAGFFPVFFKEFWAGGQAVQASTFYLGLANSVASVIVAAISPILGAIADRAGSKKRMLLFFTVLGVLMTGGLWFVGQGMWPAAAALFVLGSIGFNGGLLFYDALIVNVASEAKVDYVSSFGYSLGYIGGGLLFLINVLMYQMPEFFGFADGTAAVQFSFLTVAVWWAVFSIPIMLFVKEDRKGVGFAKAIREGLKQVGQTIREIGRLRIVATFLFAYWFYIDGVDTIIRMAVDYGSALGFPSSSLIIALLMVQFIAFPAALLYNVLAKKIGVKASLFVAIGAYSVISVFAFFMQEVAHFYILAGLVGLFQGGIQAMSRSYFTKLIPADKAGEFFGFYNMLGKFATIIGPLLMGGVTIVTGSNRLGILSVVILFVIGALLLMRVNEQENRRLVDGL